MQEDEQNNLRERVGHWLDAFEIIQEAAQRRGMAAQEAKEIAKTWVAALLPASSQAWEQRAALQRRLEDQNKRLEEIARQQQEMFQGIARPQPAPEPPRGVADNTYRWHILPILPNTSGGTLTFSTTTGDRTDCVRGKGD